MFTGIIEELGIVESLKETRNLAVLEVCAQKVLSGIKAGDSVAVNGVCLTVTRSAKGKMVFDMMRETLDKTTLGALKFSNYVNLERALKANSRLNGHFVSGHVDDVGIIKRKRVDENYTQLRVSVRRKWMRYIVEKGSVCLDGVSLTVGEVEKNYFTVDLIPFTKKVTTLGRKEEGDYVNVETDILAKYISGKGNVI